MELKDTGQDHIDVQQDERKRPPGPDAIVQDMPSIYPPTIPKPAMTVDFEYRLGGNVIIQYSGDTGVVVAAAVAFIEANILYLVEVGGVREKWYPGRMLQPAYQYTTQPGPIPGPGPFQTQSPGETIDSPTPPED